MTPDQAIAKAKAGELLPLYVVAGEERFLREQVVTALRLAALAGGLADFNEDKFTAGETDVEKIVNAARTVPMMAKRRFVLVRSIDRWETARGDDGGEDRGSDKTSPLDRLAQYAADPVPTTCVVLTAGKLDGRRKLASVARKQGFLVTCDPIDTRALAAWIRAAFKERGHPAADEVAELLAEIAGPELAYVNDAVERLALYAGAGQPITEDAVSDCIARVRTADAWALVDAVGARDLGRAMRVLGEVYDPRDHGLPLLGAVAWSVRQLARFAAAQSSGAGPDEAARRAGVPPFKARELAAKTRTTGARELERWLLVLAETDVALKSSRRTADAILEDMLVRLCGGRATHRVTPPNRA